MGWELRKGQLYYYRKRRVNGRVISIFCGSGARGAAAAREDAQRRQRAVEQRKVEVPEQTATPAPATNPPPVSTDQAQPAQLSAGERAARVLARMAWDIEREEADARAAQHQLKDSRYLLRRPDLSRD